MKLFKTQHLLVCMLTVCVEFISIPLTTTAQIDIPPPPLAIREASGLSPFYRQWVDVEGVPIVASAKVNPYQLAKPAEVSVSIHAADGKLVRTLALGQLPAGVYQSKVRAAYWDGTNEQGEPVVSGVYFYTLSAGEFTATRKMLIRK